MELIHLVSKLEYRVYVPTNPDVACKFDTHTFITICLSTRKGCCSRFCYVDQKLKILLLAFDVNQVAPLKLGLIYSLRCKFALNYVRTTRYYAWYATNTRI